ncbi:hypothetical protein [Pseudomonas oryzihabitans]|uniref:Uncharacterized protein n=1 Tax=Pseudomonas oryzihabitans TaxID=47885 RepID=A0AAJ2C260_9PSED|nr:hypothetical protein [Pseudomonas psychrotolerans]MDR6236753.1 hypothetical protein [Pseudomonas psychrotolerans]
MNCSAPVIRRVFLRRAVLTLLPLIAPALLAAESGTTLLRLQGSNTVNADLGPRLVAGLLAERGYGDQRLEPTGVMDEWRLMARAADGSTVAVQIAAHGTGTGFAALGQPDGGCGGCVAPHQRQRSNHARRPG